MSREFPLSDRYGDETQNPALQAREYERSDALLPEERALFGLGGQARRRAEALGRLCDENGFAEEEEEEN